MKGQEQESRPSISRVSNRAGRASLGSGGLLDGYQKRIDFTRNVVRPTEPARTMNVGVLASHEGTTLQSLLDAFAGGRIQGRVAVVVSNNGDSGALRRARQAGVQAVHLSSKTHKGPAALDAAIRGVLVSADVDVVCSWRVT